MNSKELARRSRTDVLKMVTDKKVGFVGSSFSCIDILAVLYNDIINYDEKLNTEDSVILSKGHAASAWYAILANKELIPKEVLNTYNDEGSIYGAHPKRGTNPYIRTSTGSLGQGLGMACGIALADRIANRNSRTYVILGDGECNEGSVWEAIFFAAKQKLSNLTIIIDRNRLQSYGTDEEVLNLGNLEDKLSTFDFEVYSIDGHNYDEIRESLNKGDSGEQAYGKPVVVVANTIKGKGVKEFENGLIWHYKWPDESLYISAKEELER